MEKYTVIRASRLIDGTGNEPIESPVVVVKDSLIHQVGIEGQVDLPKGGNVQEIVLEGETILPGLIDSHVHLALGRGANYEEMMRESDGVHLMTGIFNAYEALQAGITTIKEAGARNRVAFDLRDGWRTGLIKAPRLYVSGRPLTITGGHFHFCNDNEADGVDEVRKKVRQFLKEGADVIKIMASGGNSPGSSGRMLSFSEDELRCAVGEAHRFGRTTMAHCQAYESVGKAARAGVDVLEHCGFIMPDGTRGFDEKAVRTMAKKRIYYNPTLQTGSLERDTLLEKQMRGENLTHGESRELEEQEYKIRRLQENLARMVEMGVQIVAGSDGTGLGQSNRLLRALELMVEAGMSPMQVIVSATSMGAKALKMDHLIGSIKEGLKADMIAVEGNPTENISRLRSTRMIMQDGEIIKLERS